VEAAFGFKAFTKPRLVKYIMHMRQYSSSQIYPSPGTERQRKIRGNGAKSSTEQTHGIYSLQILFASQICDVS